MATMTIQDARRVQIETMERHGHLDPTCLTCQREFYPYYRERWQQPGDMPFAPRHKASDNCKSGKYAHCTCDACF